MKKGKSKKMTVMLEEDTVQWIKAIAKLSGADENTVINVTLAMALLKSKK